MERLLYLIPEKKIQAGFVAAANSMLYPAQLYIGKVLNHLRLRRVEAASVGRVNCRFKSDGLEKRFSRLDAQQKSGGERGNRKRYSLSVFPVTALDAWLKAHPRKQGSVIRHRAKGTEGSY